MSTEDVTPQEGTNPELESEVEETETEEETEETPAEEESEEEMVPKSQFRQALARAKKAEAMLKAKPQPSQNTIKPSAPSLSKEEVDTRILMAQGMTEDRISYLKKLAKVNGTSMIEAQTDPLFKSYTDQLDSEAKAKKAKLGASKGSGTVRPEKTITSQGLSDADHKELWKQQTGR
jgi:hypothetical protein